MAWASNLFPADLLPKITINEKGIYTMLDTCGIPGCTLCNDNKPKDVATTVKLKRQTDNFKKSVEAKAKNSEATIDVASYPSLDYAALSVFVPNAYGDDVYANVQLNADDLKRLQDAVYKARVELAKASVKNQEVYPF